MCPQTVAKANNLTSLMVGVPGPGFEFSERDCLNLNVFAPRCIESVPVICYIHGGGLKQGGNALPAYGECLFFSFSFCFGTQNSHE